MGGILPTTRGPFGWRSHIPTHIQEIFDGKELRIAHLEMWALLITVRLFVLVHRLEGTKPSCNQAWRYTTFHCDNVECVSVLRERKLLSKDKRLNTMVRTIQELQYKNNCHFACPRGLQVVSVLLHALLPSTPLKELLYK